MSRYADFCVGLDEMEKENVALKAIIKQVLNDLPVKRDWLNPDLEKAMKSAVNE